MEGRSLLISDLDGTLLGCPQGLAQFAEWYAPRRSSLHLAYSSGRFIRSVNESIAATSLPTPLAVIGGVGTEIGLAQDPDFLNVWQNTFGIWDRETLRAAVGLHKELVPQPEEFQSYYKLSYYGHDLTPEYLQGLAARLHVLGHRVELVYSSQRDLDLLPAGIDKGAAAAYLARHLRIPPERVLVAGDSANDAAMFRHGFRGIVVGNAAPELKALNSAAVYQADAPFARGVLEGLWHWGI